MTKPLGAPHSTAAPTERRREVTSLCAPPRPVVTIQCMSTSRRFVPPTAAPRRSTVGAQPYRVTRTSALIAGFIRMVDLSGRAIPGPDRTAVVAAYLGVYGPEAAQQLRKRSKRLDTGLYAAAAVYLVCLATAVCCVALGQVIPGAACATAPLVLSLASVAYLIRGPGSRAIGTLS